jgi:hypothetical protein
MNEMNFPEIDNALNDQSILMEYSQLESSFIKIQSLFNSDISNLLQLIFYWVEVFGFLLTYIGYKNPKLSDRLYEQVTILQKETKTVKRFIFSKNVHLIFKIPGIVLFVAVSVYPLYLFYIEIIQGESMFNQEYIKTTFILAIFGWLFFGYMIFVWIVNKLTTLILLLKNELFLSKIGISMAASGLIGGLYQVITIVVN